MKTPPPTQADLVTAHRVTRFLAQRDICLVDDYPHLAHVARLIAEYMLNTAEEEAHR